MEQSKADEDIRAQKSGGTAQGENERKEGIMKAFLIPLRSIPKAFINIISYFKLFF